MPESPDRAGGRRVRACVLYGRWPTTSTNRDVLGGVDRCGLLAVLARVVGLRDQELEGADGLRDLVQHGSAAEDEPVGGDNGADPEPWARAVGQTFEVDRGAPLPCTPPRPTRALRGLESDREGPRRVVVDRAAHSDDAVDVGQ